MITTIILVGVCWILAGICNAVMDVLAFKYKRSIFRNLNPNYWNPAKSWRNKYKNKMAYQGPAFPFSTTALSFLTDAWHLFQFLSNTFLALSVLVVIHNHTDTTLWEVLGIFALLKVSYGAFFELFYSRIFRTK